MASTLRVGERGEGAGRLELDGSAEGVAGGQAEERAAEAGAVEHGRLLQVEGVAARARSAAQASSGGGSGGSGGRR